MEIKKRRVIKVSVLFTGFLVVPPSIVEAKTERLIWLQNHYGYRGKVLTAAPLRLVRPALLRSIVGVASTTSIDSHRLSVQLEQFLAHEIAPQIHQSLVRIDVTGATGVM
jgi:hypothetical protein